MVQQGCKQDVTLRDEGRDGEGEMGRERGREGERGGERVREGERVEERVREGERGGHRQRNIKKFYTSLTLKFEPH